MLGAMTQNSNPRLDFVFYSSLSVWETWLQFCPQKWSREAMTVRAAQMFLWKNGRSYASFPIRCLLVQLRLTASLSSGVEIVEERTVDEG